jgi:hypothetical protein
MMRRRGEWRARYQQGRADHRTLQQICFHESAHALVAFIRGCTIERIVVGHGAYNNSSGLSGACYWNAGDNNAIDPKTRIIISLAAPAVDAFFGYRLDDVGDYENAREAAEQIGEVEAVLEFGRREAAALVQKNITPIAALAGALIRALFGHHAMGHTFAADLSRRW